MKETMKVINRLLDKLNERDSAIEILKSELNIAADKNTHLKEENERLRRRILRHRTRQDQEPHTTIKFKLKQRKKERTK